jgi:hypothetical protein
MTEDAVGFCRLSALAERNGTRVMRRCTLSHIKGRFPSSGPTRDSDDL